MIPRIRLWDKEEKKMVYYETDCSAPDMTLNGVLISHDTQSNVSYKYDLMLSTGLKDKNGKEGFKDDITLVHKIKCVIIWYKGCFYLQPIGTNEKWSIQLLEDGEVICKNCNSKKWKHVHENLELLEKDSPCEQF